MFQYNNHHFLMFPLLNVIKYYPFISTSVKINHKKTGFKNPVFII